MMVDGKEGGPAGAGEPPRELDRETLRARLEAYMAEKGLRSTDQRRLIIDTVFDSPSHLTVDELLETVRRVDSRVGYATVYRTMKMLAESGVVEESLFGDGFTRYELSDDESHHDHIICLDCGTIQEFEEPLIEELQDRVAQRFGFVVETHKHELYGRCRQEDCPRRGQVRGKGATKPS
jgi:Fur family ferric uptake transcriptional regulator